MPTSDELTVVKSMVKQYSLAHNLRRVKGTNFTEYWFRLSNGVTYAVVEFDFGGPRGSRSSSGRTYMVFDVSDLHFGARDIFYHDELATVVTVGNQVELRDSDWTYTGTMEDVIVRWGNDQCRNEDGGECLRLTGRTK